MNVRYVKGGRALWVQRLRGWNLLVWEWEEGFWVTEHLQSSVSETLLPKMDRNRLLRLTGGLKSSWRNIANTWIGLNEHGCWQWKQEKKKNSIWSPDLLGIAEWRLSSPYVDSFCFLSQVFQELTPRKAGSRLEKKIDSCLSEKPTNLLCPPNQLLPSAGGPIVLLVALSSSKSLSLKCDCLGTRGKRDPRKFPH